MKIKTTTGNDGLEAPVPGFGPWPTEPEPDDQPPPATTTETTTSFQASTDDPERPEPPDVGELPATIAGGLVAASLMADRRVGAPEPIWELSALEARELADPLARIIARRLPTAAKRMSPDVADGLAVGTRLLAWVGRGVAGMRRLRAAFAEQLDDDDQAAADAGRQPPGDYVGMEVPTA